MAVPAGEERRAPKWLISNCLDPVFSLTTSIIPIRGEFFIRLILPAGLSCTPVPVTDAREIAP